MVKISAIDVTGELPKTRLLFLVTFGHTKYLQITKKVLVDHAFIIAGGKITKQAKNWLGGKLDATKRSQILFLDREDILNLYIVSSLSIPNTEIALEASFLDDEIPF